MNAEESMRIAIAQARHEIAAGQSPFGCAIAVGGEVLAAAHNRVWATTCEPCPMCMAALHWARVDTVYYGATIADATAVGFNELSPSAEDMVRLGGSSVRLVGDVLTDECVALFEDWRRGKQARTYWTAGSPVAHGGSLSPWRAAGLRASRSRSW